MRVCFGVIVRVQINHRCVCVTSVVFVRFALSDPGVRVVTLAQRSASCARFSDGVIPRWLWGQDPLQLRGRLCQDSEATYSLDEH